MVVFGTHMADMELISKPNRPPPITAMAVIMYMFPISYMMGDPFF